MENKIKYIYEGISQNQMNVLNLFTQYKSATATQKKMAEIKGDGKLTEGWEYSGYKDTGKKGRDHCSMGHALRYVHFAKNTKNDEIVKFGIKCISDFFDITPEQLKMIKEGFVQTNKMVNQIIEKVRMGNYNFEEIKLKLNKIEGALSDRKEIDMLLNVDLPLPDQYEYAINTLLLTETSKKEFDKFLDEHPEYIGIVTLAQLFGNDKECESKYPTLYIKLNSVMSSLNKYKKISEAQIKLLQKIFNVISFEMSEKFDDIRLLHTSDFQSINEKVLVYDLINGAKEWGLSEKQVNLFNKIYDKYSDKISEKKYILINSI